MHLNKDAIKKLCVCTLGLLTIVVLSILIESLIFNFNVISLPPEEKGIHSIDTTDLELTDMILESDGTFYVTGVSPSFKIKNIKYISYLNVGTVEDSSPIHIYPSNQEGKYDVDYSVKESTLIYAGQSAEDVVFSISIDDGNTFFEIKDLAVVNNFVINWLRVYAMISFGILIAYFIFFRKIVSKKIHITFLVIALLLGSNIALMMPKSYSYDEREHYIRAYQLSRFDLGLGDNSIKWIENIDEFFEYAGSVNSEHNSYLERVNFIDKFDNEEYTKEAYYHSTAETYPFIPYIFQALGIFLARILGLSFVYTFYSGRLFGLLGYSLICFFAIKNAKVGKRLMFVIALLPSMIYTASAYSADPLTLAFSLLSFAILQKMIYNERVKLNYYLPMLFSLCIAMVVMCKVTYVPLCIMILAVPGDKFKSRKTGIFTKLIVITLCGCVAIATFIFGSIQGINQWQIAGVDTIEQVKYILTHLLTYIKIMWGHIVNNWSAYFTGSSIALAYSGELKSFWAFCAIFMLFVALIIDCSDNNIYTVRLNEKMLLVIAVVGSWILVLTALYISFTPVGYENINGVQGRYFAPLIFPLLLIFKPQKVICNWSPKRANILVSITSIMLLCITIMTLFKAYCS